MCIKYIKHGLILLVSILYSRGLRSKYLTLEKHSCSCFSLSEAVLTNTFNQVVSVH